MRGGWLRARHAFTLTPPASRNKAKANPELAAAKKEKNDACRERRKAEGSTKTFS